MVYMEYFGASVVAAVAIALACALLSVFVTIKRMAFIGQGVSHAAFGGAGLAIYLGLAPGAQSLLIAAFCLATAAGIAWVSGRRVASEDTVIGVFLVASMALGAALVSLHLRSGEPTPGASWESLLFGSILTVGWGDAAAAWAALGVVAGALTLARRPMLFYAFDESAAKMFGSPVGSMRLLLLTLVAIAIVVTMKLAGVALATALLILPGAIALRLASGLRGVFVISSMVALAGTMGGLAASFALDLPPGACIVGALTLLFIAAWPVEILQNARRKRLRRRLQAA